MSVLGHSRPRVVNAARARASTLSPSAEAKSEYWRLRSESRLSIILVEQNSRVAFEFSDRSVVMDKGRIVYDGPSAALRDDPERLAQLIGVSE